MNFAYIRVSTDKQTVENQRFEILKLADEKKIQIDEWIEETISGAKKITERQLGQLLNRLKPEDIIMVSELSRIGRNLMEIMKFLHDCMEQDVKVYTCKDRYELGNNINSKVLAFAFGLSAEIEHQLISQRTKEALSRKKSEGKQLGRPKGRLSKKIKLTGKEDEIKNLLNKKIPVSAIARLLDVHRLTVNSYIKSRGLNKRTIKLYLWLSVENNNKFVRGRKKAIEEIEMFCLSQYNMKKNAVNSCEYELTVPYETDKELDETIYELLSEIESTANHRNCFTELDTYEIGNPERSW